MASIRMEGLQLLPVGRHGPEDVAAFDDRLITGVADGKVLTVPRDGGPVVVTADTGGRPLGVETLPDGRLVVCDAERGLLRVDPHTDSVEQLVDSIDGEPMKLCDNAAVAADGAIYFTDSSRRYHLADYQADLIERTTTGRLLRRAPDGEVQVLLDHLEFANGVALSDDETFVAVAETAAARIWRVWLTGSRCGQAEILADNLPGLPDNLSTGTAGRIWVTIPTVAVRALRLFQRSPRPVRRLISRLAGAVDAPRVPARVLAINRDGRTVTRLECGRRCSYRLLTGVREYAGHLYFGSLAENSIASFPLAAAAGAD